MKNLLIKIASTFFALFLINLFLARLEANLLIHVLFDIFGMTYCIFEINKTIGEKGN